MRRLLVIPCRAHVLGGVALALLLGAAGAWRLATAPAPPPAASTPAGPPWIYGRPEARFTVIEYADLECPYCRTYFPVLRHWIDSHPEVNWQWQHLPLAMHDPAATAEARLVECAGEAGGTTAFWNAVAWVYEHTGSDGRGVPRNVPYPDRFPSMQHCLASDRPDAVIRAQTEDAARRRIAATPTLRVIDRPSGHALVLSGPVEGDALLSAIDALVDGSAQPPSAATTR